MGIFHKLEFYMNLIGQLSTVIGMKEWFAPQISEHCPKNTPECLGKRKIWLSRPGIASVFTPMEGTVHEWMTSVEDTTIWVVKLVGTFNGLEHFNNRSVFLLSMKESSSSSIRLCSYLQYHWCPVVFTTNLTFFVSSIRYSAFMEGMAIMISTMAGVNVQILSISCLSRRRLLKNLDETAAIEM